MTVAEASGAAGRRIRFGIVGSGWRSDFFLRIARELPDRFEVTGLVTRDPETTGRRVQAEWGVAVFAGIDDLVEKTSPDLVVVSVPRIVAPEAIERLVELGVPVFTETPPAIDLAGLTGLYETVAGRGIVQVAEQYHRSPILAAQVAIARSGRLGRVTQAMVAQCHDYHGVSVIRRALAVGAEDVTITASVFESPLVTGPDRGGDPLVEKVVTARQLTARFDFGDRLGVYDFAAEQYFSWIRANRVLIRGERGEINDLAVSYLADFRTPVFTEIDRVSTGIGGNLEGFFLRGLQAAGEWFFENRFMQARLNDDEIAIAGMLVDVAAHIDGGPEVYSLAEASQDLYLSLLMKESAQIGRPVRSERQIWAGDLDASAP